MPRSQAPRSGSRRQLGVLGVLVAGALLTGSCSDNAPSPTNNARPSAGSPSATIRVPADAPTIAAAVEQAGEGSLILIGPGTYPETVTVETKNLTIRGLDRNTVVLDGGDRLENAFLEIGRASCRERV